jgi:hypothetical protein
MASENVFVADNDSISITDTIIRELSELSEADKMWVLNKIKPQKRLRAAAAIDSLLEGGEILIEEEKIPELVSKFRAENK